jgi:hypothetical protein
MGSERLVVLLPLLLGACGAGVPHYPERMPLLRDPDLEPLAYPCRAICAPEEYESFVYWDLADKSVFRPVSQFFAVRPGGEAIDVNSLDEVPDSSWFENRAGVRTLTAEEKAGGPCVGQALLPPEAPPGSWKIDQGKSDGVTPGFRINLEKAGKFLLKADRIVTPFRASAAEAVGARLYWAAGFHAPCNFVYAIDPSVVRLEPGLEATSDLGLKVPFDAPALAAVFEQASPVGERRRRMGVSRWLPGRPLGPFTYDGVREDDPHDVVPHEDRRELRGARLMAAWIGHYDAREQNTMSTWMSSKPENPAAPGWVKHWYLDFGDSLGTRTKIDDLSRRYGRSYLFDPGDILVDFVTFGALVRPWETATSPNRTFPYFNVQGFVPEDWKPGYPNPAFSRMTEHDGAWMARVIARIDDETVTAAVRSAELPELDASYLVRTLLGRRDAIVRRYLSRLSPLGNVEVAGDAVCALDLASRSRLFPASRFRHTALFAEGEGTPNVPIAVATDERGRVCVTVPRASSSRRLRVRIANQQAPGALEIFLLDPGRQDGLRLLGVWRPSP